MKVAKAILAVAWMAALVQMGGAAEIPAVRSASGVRALDARAVTARIDAVLASRWADQGVQPVAIANDGEFLRRASFDLVGKIPTASEAEAFLDDPSHDKRLALVERLLESPAYTTRAIELWRQLLLPEADTEDQARAVAGGFEAWLRSKVMQDAGYDRIVRELLTVKLANRNVNDLLIARAESSPSAYYVAKEGKPENLASSAARVFLGVRLECAQCHNHPFAAWKREQFWGFAAFFANVPPQTAEEIASMRRDMTPRRELTIPGTKTVVAASHLDGSPPAWRPRADGRDVLADWITAPDNPYFTRAIVNRVWARFFGVGLVEPIDDLDLEAAAPELRGLLDDLSVQFRLHGYDLKYLIRVLTATRAYSLASVAGPAESSAPLFASMPVRGLSPGQLFDSLTQATGTTNDEARARFLDLFANREERATEAQTTILQALTMMNGAYVASATSPDTGDVLGGIAKAPFHDTASRIEWLYLATLTRRPSAQERSLLVQYVDRRDTPDERAKALADVFWAVLNGPEFRLNH